MQVFCACPELGYFRCLSYSIMLECKLFWDGYDVLCNIVAYGIVCLIVQKKIIASILLQYPSNIILLCVGLLRWVLGPTIQENWSNSFLRLCPSAANKTALMWIEHKKVSEMSMKYMVCTMSYIHSSTR